MIDIGFLTRQIEELRQERDEYARILSYSSSAFMEKVGELSIVKRIGDSISGVSSRERLCSEVVNIIIEEISAENCSLWLVDHERGVVRLTAARGQTDDMARYLPPDSSISTVLPLGEGAVGWVALNGWPLLIKDTANSKRFITIEAVISSSIRSLLCLPIKGKGGVIGALNISHPSISIFHKEKRRSLELVATQFSMAFANILMAERLNELSVHLEREMGVRAELAGGGKRHAERRQSLDDEVRRREKLYSQMFYNNQAIKILTDPESGFIIEANHAALDFYGYSKEEIARKRIWDIDTLPEEKIRREMILADSESRKRSVFRHRLADGRIRDVEVYSGPIEFQGKKLLFSIIHDITEQKGAEVNLRQAKEMAEESTKLKDKFVALVAHDLKSPLAYLLGMLEMIASGDANRKISEFDDMLQMGIESGERMVRLIDEILDISGLQSGRITLSKKFIDANMLAAATIAGMEFRAKEKKISLMNDIPPGYRLYADPILFEQALQNLLSNAIKFSRDGDTITFFVPKGEQATIAVKDTGIGIRADTIPNLFKAEIKTTTKGTAGEIGTGLGLPYCWDILQAHGGDLSVESMEGEGSVFHARLPFKRPSVLVVDDEVFMRQLLVTQLTNLDVDAYKAHNGKMALEWLDNNKADLVISDITMPGMDGFALLQALRQRSDTKTVPVMLITADLAIETRERAFRLGANDFLTKPIKSEDFVPRVRKFFI